MTDLTVMPEPDESVKCADFTLGLAVDPGGTAIRADLLIAAETPLPWPKPVFAHPLLTTLPTAVAAATVPTRVLAAVPAHDDRLSVVAYRRPSGANEPATRTEWHTDAAALAATVAAIVAGVQPADADLAPGPPGLDELWICTQGSHDVCCGTYGSRLAIAVEDYWGDRLTVRRVSHTGGHRFAPTALSLPSGRMWGYLAIEDIDALVDDAVAPSSVLVTKCRGWWGADQGPEQVAERIGLDLHGWTWDRAMRQVTTLASADGRTDVEVQAVLPSGDPVHYRATIAVARTVPTIACREPGGAPAKPGRELAVVDFQLC